MSPAESVFKLHNCDVRKFKQFLESRGSYKKFVDVTITSPPYFDLKSYGYKNQIGYGQEFSDYMNDLGKLFSQIKDVTNDTGSLWIIVDDFSKRGKLVNLPFKLAEKMENIGWKLTDILIWKKDKTLPWSSKGQLRNIFEYILFFTKTGNFKFYGDRIRNFDISQLKEWWVKYPERYNPNGALPTNVWEFPVPTQGKWGHTSLRHFNPLPPKMIERIILLTTDANLQKKDIVLDPFAGSGSVLAVADYLGRRWFGFEKNKQYCEMFENSVLQLIKNEMMIEDEKKSEIKVLHSEFQNKIKYLRLVKFPKSLFRKALQEKILNFKQNTVNTIFALSVEPTDKEKSALPKNKFMVEEIFIISNYNGDLESIEGQLTEVASKEPLSKFGIEPKIFVLNKNDFTSKYGSVLENARLWLYLSGRVYKLRKAITFSQWSLENSEDHWKDYSKNNIPPIITNIKVYQEVPTTWESKEKKFNRLKVKYKNAIGIN
ncbi:site-specific DNA-methyltransferase [Candidatus Bathyarchaeota archaeon]|nr:site-specific DNA-methyltransferase [Candidatus Bathyarchaeota archaeon]